MNKTRYALCGVSTRGISHFALPLLGLNGEGGPNFNETSELVGLLDMDEDRMQAFLKKIDRKIACYPAGALKTMIREARADVVLVATPDGVHGDNIVEALEAGCDVIVEKPMVSACEDIPRIRKTELRTGRRVRVAFNFRYVPVHKQLKRMILADKLGRITNIEFAYNLDPRHGSSYFYRWNRERARSGGLSVHKSCHHLDLINWLLDDVPEEVFAFGARNYYGKAGALRPLDREGNPLSPAEEKRRCPIFQKYYAGKFTPESNSVHGGIYPIPYAAQYADAPRYIYDDVIDIEDTYSALVRYREGAVLNYSCNFCAAWEGYILGINGTKGRAEIVSHTQPQADGTVASPKEGNQILYYPLFGGREEIEIPRIAGGHGGADYVMQNDLFNQLSAESEELRLVAGSGDGAVSVAMGEAIWRSIAECRSISIPHLLCAEDTIPKPSERTPSVPDVVPENHDDALAGARDPRPAAFSGV